MHPVAVACREHLGLMGLGQAPGHVESMHRGISQEKMLYLGSNSICGKFELSVSLTSEVRAVCSLDLPSGWHIQRRRQNVPHEDKLKSRTAACSQLGARCDVWKEMSISRGSGRRTVPGARHEDLHVQCLRTSPSAWRVPRSDRVQV